jgi:hypothetical protein
MGGCFAVLVGNVALLRVHIVADYIFHTGSRLLFFEKEKSLRHKPDLPVPGEPWL